MEKTATVEPTYVGTFGVKEAPRAGGAGAAADQPRGALVRADRRAAVGGRLGAVTKAEQREAAAILRRLADALARGELDGDAAHFHALMGAAIAPATLGR